MLNQNYEKKWALSQARTSLSTYWSGQTQAWLSYLVPFKLVEQKNCNIPSFSAAHRALLVSIAAGLTLHLWEQVDKLRGRKSSRPLVWEKAFHLTFVLSICLIWMEMVPPEALFEVHLCRSTAGFENNWTGLMSWFGKMLSGKGAILLQLL